MITWSDLKSWIYFRSHVEDWEVISSLHITTLFTQPACSSFREHYVKLHHMRFLLNWRKAVFFVGIVGPWNRVPAFEVESPSSDAFKLRLDAFWNDMFPNVIQYSITRFRQRLWLVKGFSAIVVGFPQPIKLNWIDLIAACKHMPISKWPQTSFSN